MLRFAGCFLMTGLLCLGCAAGNEHGSVKENKGSGGDIEEPPESSEPFGVTREDGCPAIRLGKGEIEVQYLDLDGSESVDLGDLQAAVYHIAKKGKIPPPPDSQPPVNLIDGKVITKEIADVSRLVDTKLSVGKVDYIDLMILSCYFGEELPEPESEGRPPPQELP